MAISEHIELPGMHSVTPLSSSATKLCLGRAASAHQPRFARELNISGPFNISIAGANDIKVID